MTSRSNWKALLISLALLVFATPALAGGWASVTLEEIPREARAGETVQISFIVKQHGNTPVHFLAAVDDVQMEPYLTARNVDTDETIRIAAERGKEVGYFTLAAVFPGEGDWEWEITPHPLVGVTEFEPLTVQPAIAKADKSAGSLPAAGNTFISQQAMQAAGAILIAVTLAVLSVAILARRRRLATKTGR